MRKHHRTDRENQDQAGEEVNSKVRSSISKRTSRARFVPPITTNPGVLDTCKPLLVLGFAESWFFIIEKTSVQSLNETRKQGGFEAAAENV